MVVERRHRQGEAVLELGSPSQFVGHQVLGAEIGGALQQGQGGGQADREIGIRPRWRAHRLGDGGPDRLASHGRPRQAAARLVLDAGIAVMLDLGSHGQLQAIGNHGDLILQEGAGELEHHMGRREAEEREIGFMVVHEAVARPPGDLLPAAEAEAVLEIGIPGHQALRESIIEVPQGLIVVGLDLDIGGLRESGAIQRPRTFPPSADTGLPPPGSGLPA